MELPATGSNDWQYQPALDGLRGIAVLAVIAFHGRAPWMQGGYVGVSVFFTLSGFLITSLLLREQHRTGSISLGAFYGRRARRLLPASTTAIVLVAIAARAGWFSEVPHLRSDLVGATLQVSNWTQLFRGGSYADQIAAQANVSSPVIHFWSLSIEEQYYWLWPLVLVGLFAATRRFGRVHMHHLLVALAVVSSISAVVIAVHWGPDAAYWATPARSAEILTGAALAGLVSARRLPHIPSIMTVGAGVALLASCVWFPGGHGPAYSGGLPLVGLTTACLLAGLQRPNRVTSALGIAPLRSIGKISYGLYVFHWPVFVAVRTQTGLTGFSAVSMELTITLAITLTSYQLIERRIRRSTSGWRSRFTAAGLAACCAMAAFVVVPATSSTYWTSAAADASPLTVPGQLGPIRPPSPVLSTSMSKPATSPAATSPAATSAAATSTSATSASPERATSRTAEQTPPPDMITGKTIVIDDTTLRSTGGPSTTGDEHVATTAPSVAGKVEPPSVLRPVRIVMVGDSTAEATGAGLVNWAKANPGLATVALAVAPGCGLVGGGIAINDTDRQLRALCHRVLTQRLPMLLKSFAPDLVVVFVTQRDEEPQNFGNGLVPVTDVSYRAQLDAGYGSFIQTILAAGSSTIVFTRMPTINGLWQGTAAASTDIVAMTAYENELTAIAAQQPNRIDLLDFRSWVEANDLGSNRAARPDGMHWSSAAATDIATRWLGPTLMRLALQAG